MFVVPVEVAPAVQVGCTETIAANERRRLVQHLEKAGAGDGAWLAEVERETVAALDRRGMATAAQLVSDVPRLRTSLVMAEGKSYQATANITSRVLTVLSAHGLIVRTRPRGSWISSQYVWAPAHAWLPGVLPVAGNLTGADDVAATPDTAERPVLSGEQARTELARRWLAAYGPATAADLKWWTGWTARQVSAALAALDTVAVELSGTPGVLLADSADLPPTPDPWVALLPALDPTVMGWFGREWYLGRHGPALFDRSGNPGPTIWCDGRVVGGWAQRADGRVAVRLLEDVGRSASDAVDAAAEKLAALLGPVRVTPRFRTPLERELSAG
jgi:hypothetical protein